MADKFDPVRMAELLSVKEEGGQLVLSFEGSKKMRVRVSEGKLVCEVSS